MLMADQFYSYLVVALSVKKKPNEINSLKCISGSPSQRAHPKHHLNYLC